MHGFIGVHIGVGKYSEDKYDDYKNLTERACLYAIEVLRSGGSAQDACCAAVKVLENDPLVNAGYGSNLTLQGDVECDASIMDGETLNFGACGAVSGVKNPIALADYLCRQQSIQLCLGLVHPCLLVGEGAKECASKIGLELIDKEKMISKTALKQHKRYKKYYKRYHDFVQRVTNDNVPNSYLSGDSEEDTEDVNESSDTAVSITNLNRKRKQLSNKHNGYKMNIRINYVSNEPNIESKEKVQTDTTKKENKIKKLKFDDTSEKEKKRENSTKGRNKKNANEKDKKEEFKTSTATSNDVDQVDGSVSRYNRIVQTMGNKRKDEVSGIKEPIVRRSKRFQNDQEINKFRWDTVGAVCVDGRGQVSAACSSGGIILKQTGRVGQAAIMGAGVWADGNVAVSTTGCGEYLIKTQLAKEIACCFSEKNKDLSGILKDKFLQSRMLRTETTTEKIAGSIVLNVQKNNNNVVGEFLWSHTAYNMGIGHMSTSDSEPTSAISTQPNETHVNSFTIPVRRPESHSVNIFL